ncbi:putative beta-lysine N-acetyltransferase [Mesobacillus persicus]|uniref:Putative beta-lysine N-acetyltransferase n=1 Tax=Mesobacillus persicus TaxID=930146 RepID=A0A1H8BH61_9BACI|nr:putative beta-lysine N-acetyltransferase [Mesobacillus persicus]SEM81227.1 putative beta-lysine N-acetyltransferase [Mesobacillus persicus]
MQKAKTVEKKGVNYRVTFYLDPFNKRVRVDDYIGNLNQLLIESERMAKEHKAEKLIFKARKEHFLTLVEHGFRFEGMICGYFLGSDCLFFSKFYNHERMRSQEWGKEDELLYGVTSLDRHAKLGTIPGEYTLKKLTENDAEGLAKLYQQIFKIYPTPLNKPEYIKETMKEGTIYFGFEHHGEIISAASAEVNDFYKNAELTDCATLKAHRKYGLMKFLLLRLEEELKSNGIYCVYSIARSLSFGMNAALHQLGYDYRGRLMNNCYIYDKLEDMNLWVKDMSK